MLRTLPQNGVLKADLFLANSVLLGDLAVMFQWKMESEK